MKRNIAFLFDGFKGSLDGIHFLTEYFSEEPYPLSSEQLLFPHPKSPVVRFGVLSGGFVV